MRARFRLFACLLPLVPLTTPAPAQTCPPVLTGQLTTSDAQPGDHLGYSVAVDGDMAVAGAPGEGDVWPDIYGAAYVYERAGPAWVPRAKLVADPVSAFASFGESVAISGDTVVIGAPSDQPSGLLTGSAYVFVRNGSTWTQQARLTAADPGLDDRFGISVAISGDTVVVGAWLADTAMGADSGAAYVFVRTGTTWTQQAKLIDPDYYGNFGWSVAANGDTAVISSSVRNVALVFTRDGSAWTRQAVLSVSDDTFGYSVAISGESVVVGANLADTPGVLQSGSAYVFVRDGTTWTQQAKLIASNAARLDQFGASVSISGDTIIIGAPGFGSSGDRPGSAYFFSRSGAEWTQQAEGTEAVGAPFDQFGHSVAISARAAMVGCPYDETPAGAQTGSVFVYEICAKPFIVTPPADTRVFLDSSATIAFEVAGECPMSFQWYRDGVPIVNGPGGASPGGGTVHGATSSNALIITHAQLSDSGVYTCRVWNIYGEATTGPAVLLVACVADINGDGFVDFSDYLEFLNHFDAGC